MNRDSWGDGWTPEDHAGENGLGGFRGRLRDFYPRRAEQNPWYHRPYKLRTDLIRDVSAAHSHLRAWRRKRLLEARR